MARQTRQALVTGAAGFIGRALRPALRKAGWRVRAGTRRPLATPHDGPDTWVECDLLRPATLRKALEGTEAAFYLVHSMAGGKGDFRALEAQCARAFAQAAAEAGVQRVVYLGGVEPRGRPSEHLASRLEVGRVLRSGQVPCVELRASMVIGAGSTSWQMCRDLAMRLPAMVLPAWLSTRTCPIDVEDVVQALVDALTVPLERSAWFDIPGPEVLSMRDILARVAALEGRKLPAVPVPLLTPRLSSMWLRLTTRADYHVARELVQGLEHDLLPHDRRYWELTGHPPRIGFDEAARRALREEPPGRSKAGVLASLEELLVARYGPRLAER